MSHTLGPWTWTTWKTSIPSSEGYDKAVVSESLVLTGPCGCRIMGPFAAENARRDYPGSADARLIAAAPEMFALLSRLLDTILTSEDLMNQFAKLDLEQAAAAIRKAKGE